MSVNISNTRNARVNGKCFKRLDTHLRVSTTCRTVASSPSLNVPSPSMNSICQTTVSTVDAHTTAPVHFKPHLTTPEEWEEADHLLSAMVPSVLQAVTAEEKNSCLCTAIYDILSTRFGTRAPSCSLNQSQFRLRQHDRALKEATRLTNEARRALRQAKRKGASGPTVQSLTGIPFPSPTTQLPQLRLCL